MSLGRKGVRHAAANYLSSPQIPGIGKVFPSPPKIARSSDAYENLPAGTPSGSVLFVEILDVREVRIALGGSVSGAKKTLYTLRFHLLFRSRQDTAQEAMDDHDDQLEAIMDRLRADRTLGTNGAILQFGQDEEGISVATGMPKTSGTGSTIVWSVIDGNAFEYIVA